jgi:hypothetical protein
LRAQPGKMIAGTAAGGCQHAPRGCVVALACRGAPVPSGLPHFRSRVWSAFQAAPTTSACGSCPGARLRSAQGCCHRGGRHGSEAAAVQWQSSRRGRLRTRSRGRRLRGQQTCRCTHGSGSGEREGKCEGGCGAVLATWHRVHQTRGGTGMQSTHTPGGSCSIAGVKTSLSSASPSVTTTARRRGRSEGGLEPNSARNTSCMRIHPGMTIVPARGGPRGALGTEGASATSGQPLLEAGSLTTDPAYVPPLLVKVVGVDVAEIDGRAVGEGDGAQTTPTLLKLSLYSCEYAARTHAQTIAHGLTTGAPLPYRTCASCSARRGMSWRRASHTVTRLGVGSVGDDLRFMLPAQDETRAFVRKGTHALGRGHTCSVQQKHRLKIWLATRWPPIRPYAAGTADRLT